jgi:PEP-CTERM motif
MQRRVVQALFVAVAAFASAPTWAVLITTGPYAGTDVGDYDELLGYGRTRNSNPSTELAFFNAIANTSYQSGSSDILCATTADCAAFLYPTDDGVQTFALALDNGPEYYLIKTGAGSSLSSDDPVYGCSKGQGQDCDHFVFENLGSLDWGVFSLGGLGFGEVTTIEKISHADQYGTTTHQVPEPGTLSMFGAGVLSLAWLRRRSRLAGATT